MIEALDAKLVQSLPELNRLQQKFYAATQHFSTMKLHSRRETVPNVAEFFLVAARPRIRLALWLERADPPEFDQINATDLLELRFAFARGLTLSAESSNRRVVPNTKVQILATFLCCTPCPTVSGLASFAEIYETTAKAWLHRLTSASLLKCHRTPNELFFFNALVVSRLTGFSREILNEHFEHTVARRDWLKRSAYRSIS